MEEFKRIFEEGVVPNAHLFDPIAVAYPLSEVQIRKIAEMFGSEILRLGQTVSSSESTILRLSKLVGILERELYASLAASGLQPMFMEEAAAIRSEANSTGAIGGVFGLGKTYPPSRVAGLAPVAGGQAGGSFSKKKKKRIRKTRGRNR